MHSIPDLRQRAQPDSSPVQDTLRAPVVIDAVLDPVQGRNYGV